MVLAGGLPVALAADLPGRVGEAEAADQDGAGAPQGAPHVAAALSARDLAAAVMMRAAMSSAALRATSGSTEV